MRLPKLDRLSWRLGVSIAALVVAGQAAGFLFVYRHSHRQLLGAMREHAERETTLIRLALEDQMLKKDDHLLRSMVHSFARDQELERVMILDREGRVKFSSDPSIRQEHFHRDSPTCQVCHRHTAGDRERSTLLEVEGGRILRAVQPIPNGPACHACHDPGHRINGIIVTDLSLEGPLAGLARSVGILACVTGVIGLLVLAGISLTVRRLVLKRLLRFEAAARALGQGEYDRRVPVEGDDALTRVEEQFNEMADSITGLLADLRQHRASLERVMNSVDDGMVVLDRERRIVAANQAFTRRFPHFGGEPLGTCCSPPDAVNPGCGVGACPTLDCFETGKVQTAIRTYTLPGGGTRQEEVRSSPVHGPDGTITNVVEVWRDITDRRSAEAHLAEYQRLVSLGMLASGFSHEVNTPLASVTTCLDGIARVCGAPGSLDDRRGQIEEFARIGATQVQRAGTITEQFLQLARGRSLDSEPVNLTEVAEATVRLCKHKASQAGVRIEIAAPPSRPTVGANPAAVQQVLLNLVFNAIEASPPGQAVTLRIENDGVPAIVVRDEGCGIAPADLDRIFEPFFTLREKGTGLGLFVSANLARGWGGDIIATSRPGTGSTFRVTFPPARAPEDDARQDPGR